MTVERTRLRRPRSETGRRVARKIERPPAHWFLLGLFVGTLILLLLAEGLTVHTTGASGTPPPLSTDRTRALPTDKALLVAGQRPGAMLVLGLALLLVNAVGIAAALMPFLTLTVAYTFLVAAHFLLEPMPEPFLSDRSRYYKPSPTKR